MVDSLENRIGIALKATQYQMQHSDAKEGLTYMHERVEELREFGNPWSNLQAYYNHHLEIVLFLKHIGFREFDEEQLRLTYNHIVNAVYYNEVKEDSFSGRVLVGLQAQKLCLQKSLPSALPDHLPEPNDYLDRFMVLDLPEGVYRWGDRDLVRTAKAASSILHNAERVEKWLRDYYECQFQDMIKSTEQCLNGLEKYEGQKPAIDSRIDMMLEEWFRPPIFRIRDIIPALRGDFRHLHRRIDEIRMYHADDYLERFPLVKEKIDKVWGRSLNDEWFWYPEFLDHTVGLLGPSDVSDHRRSACMSGANITYHILEKVRKFYGSAEENFKDIVAQIREKHPRKVEQYKAALDKVNTQLPELNNRIRAWESNRQTNTAKVHESKRLKDQAYHHPWITNTHPTFNTSAYLAKLISLSTQLEALQQGHFPSAKGLLSSG